jgi:hypothetical protein
MNRADRRAAAAQQRHQTKPNAVTLPPDRAALLRIAARLVEDDASISGATLIEPSGRITFLDAELLRRGGSA